MRVPAVLVLLVSSVGLTAIDDPAPQRTPPVTTNSESAFTASNCKNCHNESKPDYVKEGRYDFILPDCSKTWETRDPHARAFKVLESSNPLAVRMSERLGYDVSKQPECLVCHAVDVYPTAEMAKKEFNWSYGVGCESCHGVAEKWVGPHVQKRWREVEPAEKAKLGLIDLRNPEVRAAKCAGCHVGNAVEGRFVTHEMYAAGHPPLLPFEAATFGRDQPAHWKPPEEMPYIASLPADKRANLFHAPVGQHTTPRAVALGAVVTLRESAKLLATEAERATKDSSLLDYAHFDCFACHHELAVPSRRQARGYVGIPGRPTLRPLAVDLTEAVLSHAHAAGAIDRVPELRSRLADLTSAADRRAFGDTAAIATAAHALAAQCDTWLTDVRKVTFDDAGRTGLVKAILATGTPGHWDYDAAQLQAWAASAVDANSVRPEVWQQLLRSAGFDVNASDVNAQLKSRLKLRYGFDPEALGKVWR